MTTPWSGLEVDAVTDDTGNLIQLYPASCSPGSGSGLKGSQIRKPQAGITTSMQIQTDGINGGVLELWDVNGADAGADVDTLNVITAAQLNSLVARGMARILWSQNLTGSFAEPMRSANPVNFSHGIAARFVNQAGVGKVFINIFADGGFCYTDHS